ncbi:hypothetical protein AMS68_006992 [Peltaster fructicola]|uniref:Uncharacterized protein n=1 Tax=Peltaster fructicola TaxID=286661 RepID=A0A6H0Y3G4_9PEZI|nr:hypothetical protein AMS68_006992 [Peltaster fructicola]
MQLSHTLVLTFAAVLPVTQGFPQLFHGSSGFISKGVFQHDGVEFELQTRDPHSSPAEAYQEYLDSIPDSLEERGYDPHKYPKYPWFNCTAEGTFVGGCNNHGDIAPKQFFNGAGYYGTKNHLKEMMTAAFKDGRGKQNPRSICRTLNGKDAATLCVSWWWPVEAALQPFQQISMIDFAMSCVGPKGLLSSSMRAGFDDDITDTRPPDYSMVCISNRANGCQPETQFCTDLWNMDERGRNYRYKEIQAHWDTDGRSFPWAQGPCTENCDDM